MGKMGNILGGLLLAGGIISARAQATVDTSGTQLRLERHACGSACGPIPGRTPSTP